ncbi:2',3'-cyclic nucleotide 2'-phosphodiesterase [Syntrophotalea carbinolica DSM 2380]|uniref:2',3'-cyclic nucleotide 2'-phosphodiesterase n=1 Tax=Syntrophotalea carbinolica (strain DSM 2380 / NBRC 103641 / GraBd1) TaxID=338963 RepID=Q3A219_SYNC1|nr:TIGR00282 family metallophosphoesterase [Syntrophotalea carbinolica]ABA89588.1 2',3'-cyclic nucleotide 2'-phosphodiesterase [Syntrophotalea carbinolica DSM 2380]
MNILFIGDIIGRTGRRAVENRLHTLVDAWNVDLVVANGENAAAGFGLTVNIAAELYDLGIDVLTSGNHIWDKREIYDYLDCESRLLRPGNYPPGLPGRGSGVYATAAGTKVGVLNLEGRVFMNNLECPFLAADREIEMLRQQTPIILVDFHAEATSEKAALGFYLDGRVSAVIGTHTHVQTADERVLAGGTAFISDAGLTGSRDAVIGMRKEGAIDKFLTQLPVRFEVAKKDPVLCGVLVEIDEATGKASRVHRILEEIG